AVVAVLVGAFDAEVRREAGPETVELGGLGNAVVARAAVDRQDGGEDGQVRPFLEELFLVESLDGLIPEGFLFEVGEDAGHPGRRSWRGRQRRTFSGLSRRPATSMATDRYLGWSVSTMSVPATIRESSNRQLTSIQ